MRFRAAAVAFLTLAVFTSGTAAQTTAPEGAPSQAPAGQLRVYLDCQHECDFDFLRTNVAFVDWVRDRASSDVHLLVTTQTTGGGGSSWTLKFIGAGPVAGVDETLTFATASTDTSDARRKELARIVRLGLARYAVRTGRMTALDVTFRPAATAAAAAPTKDPWNSWVFSTSVNGNMGGERTSRNRSYRLSFSANRVTANWKINLSTNGNYNENSFDVDDTTTFTSLSRNRGVNSLVVKSLNAGRSCTRPVLRATTSRR